MLKGLLSSFVGKKAKNEPKEITCPYCFKKFSHEGVHFRASAYDETDEYGLQPDRELIEWFDKFELGEPDDLNSVIKAEDVLFGNRKYVDNVLTGVTDYRGNYTARRLCPGCHNELPGTAGKSPILIISVIGTTSSGKSVYLTTLINQLLKHTAANLGASIIPVSSQVKQLYQNNYYKDLFIQGKMLRATEKKLQFPLIYHLNFKDDPSKQSVTVCFFDVAGESVTTRDLLEIQASNIKNSDALMFLVDPTNLESIKHKLSLESGKEFETIKLEDDPSAVITSLYEDFIHQEEGGATKKPTAVLLTKSDLLYSMADDQGEIIRKNSNMFQNFVHKKQFNLTAYENINGEVKRFIDHVDPQLFQQIDSYFDNTGYFAVSALGSEPVKDEENGRPTYKVNGIVNPFRVDEPLLWILYQNGLIDGGYEE